MGRRALPGRVVDIRRPPRDEGRGWGLWAPSLAMTRDELERLDIESLRALARERLAGQGRGLRTRSALLAELGATLEVPPAPGRRTASAPPPGRPGSAGPAAADAPVEEGFFAVPRPVRRRRGPPPPPAVPLPPLPEAGRRTAPSAEVPQLLVRDPNTLFLFWDFRRDLAQGAALGLPEPRVLFHLFDGETPLRTLEVGLERRSAYLEGLTPGHTYRVEAWFSGSDGQARPTGRRSTPLTLPPASPSAELRVETVRVPWSESLASWRRAAHPAPGQRLEPLGAPGRLDLPASLEWRGGPGPPGPRSGRP